jgi:PiT family inorganic phosphate transporter
MGIEYIVLILAYIIGFYMAWNIGANDVANSMASAVGAKAITIRQAVFIAGILNIVGALFLGSHVTNTIRKGIVSTEILSDPHIAMVGALAALLSSALWVTFATWKSLPVSTTHSIVGSMIGFGIMAGGFSVIHFNKLFAVVMSWIISPIFSLVLSYLMFSIIVRFILKKKNAYDMAIMVCPYLSGLIIFIVVLSFLFKTPFGQSLNIGMPIACLIALILSFILGLGATKLIGLYTDSKSFNAVEMIFRKIQIGTSCYMSLAQGANDVANAIGPLALIYFLVKTGAPGSKIPVPIFLLLFGGVGIAAGISMWGYRVMDTVGHKITTLTNTRGFSVDFAAASTVLIASKLGLPVSTTHAAVGGVIGVGLARGLEAVNFGIIGKVIVYWVITVPAAALTCMIFFYLFNLFL